MKFHNLKFQFYNVDDFFHERYKNEGKWRPFVSSAVKVVTVGGLLANTVVTALLLLISCHNYPGGVALQRLHSLLHNQTTGLQCYYFREHSFLRRRGVGQRNPYEHECKIS